MTKKLIVFASLFIFTFQIKSQQIGCVDLSSKSTPLFFLKAIEALGLKNKALNECIKQIAEENQTLNMEIIEILEDILGLNKELKEITKKNKMAKKETKKIIKENLCCPTTIVGETISEPGLYTIATSENVHIEIDSDNVTIDLCEKIISGDPASSIPVIMISSDHENITIKNGTINGNNKNNDGIWVEENSKSVVIEDISFLHCNNGITFDGKTGLDPSGNPTHYLVEDCKVNHCSFSNCNNAIHATYTESCTFKNCNAFHCKHAGFSLENSNFNTCETCETIEIGDDTPETSATAFSSSNGTGNLFLRCFATKTFKDASQFCKNATSFLLSAQEKETKIIDCIINSTQSIGYGNAYGIHLDMTLKDKETEIHSKKYAKHLYTVSWSPNSEHIAAGGRAASIGPEINNLYILNTKTKSLDITAAKFVNNAKFDKVAWSPNGQFLAAGISDLNPLNEGAFIIYEFNAETVDSNERLRQLLYTKNVYPEGIDAVLGIDWSPDNQYIAVFFLNSSKSSLWLAIFHFDGVNTKLLTNLSVASTTGINPANLYKGDVSFSPGGKKVAVAHNAWGPPNVNEPALEVYAFDPLAGEKLDKRNIEVMRDFVRVESVDFSPISCLEESFIAVGGRDKIKAFSAKPGAVEKLVAETTELGIGSSMRWSPNGKYLLATTVIFYPTSKDVKIYEFHPSEDNPSQGLVEKLSIALDGIPSSVDWSPSGKFFAAAGIEYSPYIDKNIFVYEVGNVPEKCVIENNTVSNTSGGLGGIGISGAGGENLIVENEGYENNINFTWGIFNSFKSGLNKNPKKLDNLSVPPHFSSLLVD